ncbi:DUF58 domain-containing protein [Fulvivirga ligni]|uniref:DUF58 domain-containing protein n=1 Tax=Fulvivirga ligni TaxID=2904246 RepID=UPI001F43D33D|nr:DUF58 domain-containing protein [Fulvivirga ligni]UII19487.1 DUF58 domain-containing protein [Fulvivirga ligni]
MRIKNLYLPFRFFAGLGAIFFLFVLGYPFYIFFPIAQTALVAFLVVVITDIILAFQKSIQFKVSRTTSRLMSLGNENEVNLTIINQSPRSFLVNLIDELPFQLQIRDFGKEFSMFPNAKKKINYTIRPLVRGQYEFGAVHLYISSKIGLVQRKITFDINEEVAVYPSVMDMKKYELKSAMSTTINFGIKKIRRIGHSYEFEQIKEYTRGDDYKSMNWKATSRSNKLMVNSYTDEKSQQVYCLIDKSRYMKMPFNGLSLLDYAINSSLVIANTSLQKQDKAGLITFSNRVESIVKADRGRNQLKFILETLYREKESKLDANYEHMYSSVQRTIRGRSLVFLFTNFESLHSLERVLPVLRKLNKSHLLVVVVFENRELIDYYNDDKKHLKDIYYKTVAHKIANEREMIINELRHYGIQHIFTRPENLSINAINKYLELKSRGMI